MLMRPAIFLALSASTPPLIPTRSRGALALDDNISARDCGRIGHAVALQNLVDRGEAATMEDAQQLLSARGYAASLQRLVESGEAASLEEAAKALSARGRSAALQNLVDKGEAATLEEAQQSYQHVAMLQRSRR